MELNEYLETINKKQIPDTPPSEASPDGHWFPPVDNYSSGDFLKPYEARRICNELGLWTVIDKVWTKALAEWIGNRKVLEIMAGGGWLAKALDEFGVDIIATDDYSWNEDCHKNMNHVYPVQQLHALEAIATNKADVLLVSWPPYGDETIVTACRLWGNKRPIVYIGEPEGGCNAPDEFFAHFKTVEDELDIPLMSWGGIHDYVFIGYWQETPQAQQ